MLNKDKIILAKFCGLEYTTFIYFDGKENFDIRMPAESRWLVQTGGSTISFHFPVMCLRAFAHQGESPGSYPVSYVNEVAMMKVSFTSPQAFVKLSDYVVHRCFATCILLMQGSGALQLLS